MAIRIKQLRCRMGRENVLLIFTVAAVVMGVIIGVVLQFTLKEDPKLTKRQIMYLKFPGEIFIRALKMIILPLITSSLISSLANLDPKSAGHIGIRAFIYYLTTTLLAVITGIILVVIISPGTRGRSNEDIENSAKHTIESCFGGNSGDTIMDLIRNMFPSNIIEAASRSERTCYSFEYKVGNESRKIGVQEALNLQHNQTDDGVVIWTPNRIVKRGMNILGVIMFSIILGGIIGCYREKCNALAEFFSAVEYAIMKMVTLIIWYSPIGIMFLIAAQIIEIDDPVEEFKKLGWYILTVLVGLAIHALITLILILALLGRRNPIKFVFNMSQALFTALGTSSSSATMPLTLKCLEEKIGVDDRVTRFMVPLGATINMDGTALYEAVAAVYISQYIGQHLNAGEIILTSLTATLASIGAAGIPGAGLVTLMMVLIAVNLPAEFFVIIIPVDWFLDRIRTTVNVHGDAIGAAVVERLCRAHLEKHELDTASITSLDDTLHRNVVKPRAEVDAVIEDEGKEDYPMQQLSEISTPPPSPVPTAVEITKDRNDVSKIVISHGS